MSEENKKNYRVKLTGVVSFINGDFEKFEDVDVLREGEGCIIILKDKMDGIDLFRTSITYPLRNVKSLKTTITEAKEV
jgi:hypothetical protein